MNVNERSVSIQVVENARTALQDPERLLMLLREVDYFLSREEPPPVQSLERAEPTDELLLRVRNALEDSDDKKARRSVGYMLAYLADLRIEQ